MADATQVWLGDRGIVRELLRELRETVWVDPGRTFRSMTGKVCRGCGKEWWFHRPDCRLMALETQAQWFLETESTIPEEVEDERA